MVFFRKFQHRAYAADMAGEEGDDDAALHFGENGVQIVAHLPFGQGAARVLHIGGIGQMKTYALLFSFFGKAGEIGKGVAGFVVQRGLIELDVAGMEHLADGSFHGQSVALGNGMVHGKEVEDEAAQRHRTVGGHGHKFHPVQQGLFLKLVFHKGKGEGGTVNAYAAQTFILEQEPRQGSYVIFVAVGEHDAEHFFTFGKDGIQPGDDDIHAEQRVIGKHEAAIHQHNPLVGLPLLAVHADFAVSSQRGYGQVRFRHVRKIL